MTHRVLVLISLVCCGLLLASFGLFVRDQLSVASAHQQGELSGGSAAAGAPSAAVGGSASGSSASGQASGGAPSPAAHVAQPRRFIDGAANDLSSPFRSIVASQNPWVSHGVPTVLGLLVYGGGLGFLARYLESARR